MRRLKILTVVIIMLMTGTMGFPAERDQYADLERLYQARKSSQLTKQAWKFFKRYPKSNKIPDIRLMMAELETKPEEAIRKFRVLVEKFRYYKKRDYAQLKICEIYYLLSRWDNVIKETVKGQNLFPKSAHLLEMKFLLSCAYIYKGMYNDARSVCDEITELSHNYQTMARVTLLKTYIEMKNTGYSRNYIYRLRELLAGFKNADTAPSAIYMAGRYYEQAGNIDPAFSAYSDVVRLYPDSPESRLAERRINKLKVYNPRYVGYIPGEKLITGTDSIDIKPEHEYRDTASTNNDYYAISLGPFTNIRRAYAIERLIKNDFHPVKMIKVSKNYRLFVGQQDDSDSAVSIKIRLAEEYGLNGIIVRFKKRGNRKYIYGE